MPCYVHDFDASLTLVFLVQFKQFKIKKKNNFEDTNILPLLFRNKKLLQKN